MPHDAGALTPHSLHSISTTFNQLSALRGQSIQTMADNGADRTYLEHLQRAKRAADKGAALAKKTANLV